VSHRASDPGRPAAPALALVDVSKAFGAVPALREVTLELRAGEIHGLAGENGAGKSTVVKTFAGVHRPDTGQVHLDGRPVVFHGPADAQRAGIAVIYQEPTLFPDLSVAENIFMGRQPRTRFGRLDRRAMDADAAALFRRLGVALDPREPARGLSIADQQIVEIAKAISRDARVLIMDEPTAALSGREVSRLFAVARTLSAAGRAILFISHRLEEIFSLCRRVTTLRDGVVVATDGTADITPDDLVRRMVGRELDVLFPERDTTPGEVALRVSRLTREGVFTDISLEVRRGEIVALAGLVGAGRSEVARAIFGVDRWDAGEVAVAGRRLPPASPTAAMAAGLALVPEDRRQQGLVMELSIARNVSLTGMKAVRRGPLVSAAAERDRAGDWALRLRLKYGRLADAVGMLSGGNQQKVVLAKWLATDPAVLIVDEPTRGIDVGTKAEVHRLLSELAAKGIAVLMISSDLPEVLGMADRILVMHEGRLAAELSRDEASEERVMAAATGRSVSDRTTTDRAATGQTLANRAATGRAATDRAATGPAATGPDEPATGGP
jgi:rhamnose transport system ATP-binding protein